MAIYRGYRQSEIEVAAPVSGGMRWRSANQDYYYPSHRHRSLTPRDKEKKQAEPPPREAPAPLGPFFTTAPPEEAKQGEEYVYQAKAFDAAVSGFTWFLATAPNGMTVDRYTGRITWTPQDGGYAEVVLGASTVHGRMAQQSWTICVRKPAARKPTANPRYREALRRRAEAIRSKNATPVPRFIWREARRSMTDEKGSCQAEAAPGIRPRAPPPLRI